MWHNIDAPVAAVIAVLAAVWLLVSVARQALRPERRPSVAPARPARDCGAPVRRQEREAA